MDWTQFIHRFRALGAISVLLKPRFSVLDQSLCETIFHGSFYHFIFLRKENNSHAICPSFKASVASVILWPILTEIHTRLWSSKKWNIEDLIKVDAWMWCPRLQREFSDSLLPYVWVWPTSALHQVPKMCSRSCLCSGGRQLMAITAFLHGGAWNLRDEGSGKDPSGDYCRSKAWTWRMQVCRKAGFISYIAPRAIAPKKISN